MRWSDSITDSVDMNLSKLQEIVEDMGSAVPGILQARTREWVAIYSAIKMNTLEPILMRWMNLEPITQSEVSQKEKNKYCILMHIYGVKKNDTDETYLQGSNRDTDVEN